MTVLEKAKKSLELKKVGVAREEMAFRILEKEDDIQRLKANIVIQEARMKELEDELSKEG